MTVLSTKARRAAKFCLVLSLMAMSIGSTAVIADQAAASQADEIATRVVSGLIDHDFAKAEAVFNDRMRQALPADQLKGKWLAHAGAGNGVKIGELHDVPYQEYTIVWVKTINGPDYFWTKVVVDESQKVAGLGFAPKSAQVGVPGG